MRVVIHLHHLHVPLSLTHLTSQIAEMVMEPAMICQFNDRYCEGCDDPGDELYTMCENA